jgi:hypothetical protein
LGINKDTIPETDLTLLAYVFLTLSFIILWTLYNIIVSSVSIYFITKYNNIETIDKILGYNFKWLTPHWREKLINVINRSKNVTLFYIVIESLICLVSILGIVLTCLIILWNA